ncbi:hypothetical protein M406DRAFT_68001 [Cryphonectria parasitica EP155]|uniref:Uncharacterized protein n=1 Tax=Cryphonectria parasitica (strain ATCC 38755 / EP155) TaxID=660469 RepID=A0A9P5CQ21_CRYP1|nr:uncharacterized protein M406DRAFT_68001 [Cryphonectria parasitica EP155]KAF3765575.1 hypothetical protein M406DRAFT_68001 [Cryphonectria parasitica EP155]
MVGSLWDCPWVQVAQAIAAATGQTVMARTMGSVQANQPLVSLIAFPATPSGLSGPSPTGQWTHVVREPYLLVGNQEAWLGNEGPRLGILRLTAISWAVANSRYSISPPTLVMPQGARSGSRRFCRLLRFALRAHVLYQDVLAHHIRIDDFSLFTLNPIILAPSQHGRVLCTIFID